MTAPPPQQERPDASASGQPAEQLPADQDRAAELPQREQDDPSSGGRLDSYVLAAISAAVTFSMRLTPYRLLARPLFRRRFGSLWFADTWVIANLLVAVLSWVSQSSSLITTVTPALLVYGSLRVWEVCIFTFDVMIGGTAPEFDLSIRSSRRNLILGVLNYSEVLFWFAAAYRYLSVSFGTNAEFVATATGSFYFSILTMATYGDITPKTTSTQWLVALHLGISIYLTIGVLARIVSTLPRQTSRDKQESDA